LENNDSSANESEEKKAEQPPSSYPEKVEFTGVVYSSLKQLHISAVLIALTGVIATLANPRVGLTLLLTFLLIIMGVEAWMIRKSRKELRITLHLRENPVVATRKGELVGEIVTGAIDPDMDEPNELGFRPAPRKSLIVWTFDTLGEKEIVQKRLLEYLPRDSDIP
jgi:hypothetical protein